MKRPVLVIQANTFNESRIATVIVAVITSNRHWQMRPEMCAWPPPIPACPSPRS
jgi:mRNA-degrading endonuclease toxin of MazEF toxin-antitoxin module